MSKFKAGDRVRLVNISSNLGERYLNATGTVVADYSCMPIIRWDDNQLGLSNGGFLEARFELITDNEKDLTILTDQQLADFYRETRKEAGGYCAELFKRGYSVEFVDPKSGLTIPVSIPVAGKIVIEKTVTSTTSL